MSVAAGVLAPRGPSGSSSTASRRVGWATRRRGVRREGRLLLVLVDGARVDDVDGAVVLPAGAVSSDWGTVEELLLLSPPMALSAQGSSIAQLLLVGFLNRKMDSRNRHGNKTNRITSNGLRPLYREYGRRVDCWTGTWSALSWSPRQVHRQRAAKLPVAQSSCETLGPIDVVLGEAIQKGANHRLLHLQ